jgi:integrase
MLVELTAAGHSPRTVQYALHVLRIALARAVRWGLVPRNVATMVDGPRVPRRRVPVLTGEEAQRFMIAVRDDRLGALYVVALSLGLRQGEVLGLRWSDVDLDRQSLTVGAALQRVSGKGLVLVEPKTETSRRKITLPGYCLGVLREHRVRQLRDRLLAGSRWSETGLVFTSALGTGLESGLVTKRLQRILAACGLPRLRFHDLRHSAASLLGAQGVPPRVVMEVLGHSRISVTMDLYSHVFPSLLGDAAKAMERALGQTGISDPL